MFLVVFLADLFEREAFYLPILAPTPPLTHPLPISVSVNLEAGCLVRRLLDCLVEANLTACRVFSRREVGKGLGRGIRGMR